MSTLTLFAEPTTQNRNMKSKYEHQKQFLARVLDYLRGKADVTQRKIEEKMDFPPGYLYDLKHPKRAKKTDPTAITQKIMAYYGVTLDDLNEFEGELSVQEQLSQAQGEIERLNDELDEAKRAGVPEDTVLRIRRMEAKIDKLFKEMKKNSD